MEDTQEEAELRTPRPGQSKRLNGGGPFIGRYGGHHETPKSISIFLARICHRNPWLPGSVPVGGVGHEKLNLNRSNRNRLPSLRMAYAPRGDHGHLGYCGPGPAYRRGGLCGADDSEDLAGVSS